MYRIEEIKRLLRNHNYVPIVQECTGGVLVKLPHAKLCKKFAAFPPLIGAYSIKRGLESGIYFNSNVSREATAEKFIQIPEYAIRLFIMADVSACCQRISVSEDLIVYIDDKGVEQSQLEGVMESPSKESDRSREGFLIQLILEARKDGFPAQFDEIAETHEVREGYQIIKSFFSHYGVRT